MLLEHQALQLRGQGVDFVILWAHAEIQLPALLHGAAQFGFRVLWVNRGGVPEDNLPGKIVAQIKDLSHLPSELGVS